MYQYNNVFDEEFASKLKTFYLKEEVRRVGRSQLIARILLELAIESRETVFITDHHLIHDSKELHKKVNVLFHIQQLLVEYEKRNIKFKIYKLNVTDGIRIDIIDKESIHIYNKLRLNYIIPNVQEETKSIQKKTDWLLICCNIC